MEKQGFLIPSRIGSVKLRVTPGHFATTHSHVNYYLDMTEIRNRQFSAQHVAMTLAQRFTSNTVIHTIICLDDTQMIGGFLAQALSRNGFRGLNQGESLYVITPEYNTVGQMIFRENTQPLLRGRNVLVLMASVTTGKTIQQCEECLEYYGGRMVSVASVFSAVEEIDHVRIEALFHASDIPHYASYRSIDCPLCKQGVRVDAMVNGFGYSML